MDKRTENGIRKMVLVKKYLRDIAQSMMLPCSSPKEQERGRKLYGASKALEDMIDEAVYALGIDMDQEGNDDGE